MVGHLAVADDVLQAGDLVREHRGHQVFGLHPLQLRRHLLAATEARQRQRGARVPAEARREQRRIQQRLDQDVAGGIRMQERGDVEQREAVAGRQRQHDRVFRGGRLQLEVEAAAEALAQGQAPGLVDAAAEGRVDHQVGGTGLVEEALHRQLALRRHQPEAGDLLDAVVQQLPRRFLRKTDIVHQPALGDALAFREFRLQFLAQARDRLRQHVGAARRLAQPERDRRRRALRILHPQAPRLDTEDAVARIAQLEDVAGQALDREVFVDRADADALRLQQHRVIADVGNGAAALDRHLARAAARTQLPVHPVAMHPRAAGAEAAGIAFGQHPEHAIECLAGERAVGPCANQHREQRIFVPIATGHFSHDHLRQHVQRRFRHRHAIQLAATHAIQQRGAFHQVVAGGREQAPFRHAADVVAGAAHALQERGDAARAAELADQVDIADVDAEFQRRGGHQDLQFAALQALLGIQPQLLRHRPVVRGHVLLAQPLAQVARRAFGHAPGVDEDERGPVFRRQCLQAVVHLLPLLAAGDRAQGRQRQFKREVARLVVADVDDAAIGSAGRVHPRGPHQETRRVLDRLLRGRQAHARRPPTDQRIQSFQRQGQVAAALARQQRMDFIDDHRAHATQHRPAGLGAQQHVQRFRRGHQDVRRPLAQCGAFGLRGVAGAHRGADVDVGQGLRGQCLADAGQRRFQVQMDVVRQRLQRRDVQHQGGVRQPVRQRFAHQRVDRGEEGRERLAGAGRRGDQGVAAGCDRRPGLLLGVGGRGEAAREPVGDGRMEGVEHRGWGGARGHARIIRPIAMAATHGAGRRAEIEADLRVHPRSLRGCRLSQ